MTKIPKLDVVWQGTTLVGRVQVPGAMDFLYAPDWVRHGYNLSPLVVPFGEQAYRISKDAFDQLPGFLSDCLPDQWGRRILLRDFPSSIRSPKPIEMLAWVGRRGLGALSFKPALGDEDASSKSWTELSAILLTREAQAVMKDLPSSAFPHLRNAGTAGGAFPKATVALTGDGMLLFGGDVAAQALVDAGARLGILKLDCEDDPSRPSTDGRMECAYLKMASAAGLRTAKAELFAEPAGVSERTRHHLFVERFDVRAGCSERLHLVSLAGILESFELRYVHLLEATRRLTADRRELLEAVRRMVFNVRAANADDHGKNHAYLFDASAGNWILSPAYDLTLNYATENRYHGLFATSFGTSPRRASLSDLALEFGLSQREFDEVDAEVVDALRRWPQFAREVEL